MRHRYLLGASVALAVALSWAGAQAQLFAAPSGPGTWYFGGQAGWSNLDNQSGAVGLKVPPGSIKVHESWNDGFNAGVRGGFEWGPWRLEEEFSYQDNGLHSMSLGAPGAPGWPAVNQQSQRRPRRLCVHDQPDIRL